MIHESPHDSEDAQGDGGQLRQSHGDDENVSYLKTSGFITEKEIILGIITVSAIIFLISSVGIVNIRWFSPEVRDRCCCCCNIQNQNILSSN